MRLHVPHLAHQHRLGRCVQRHHLPAGRRDHDDVRLLHQLRSVPAHCAPGAHPHGALEPGQVGDSGQCDWAGVCDVYVLLVVLAEYGAGDAADDELECGAVHGGVYLVFGLVCD